MYKAVRRVPERPDLFESAAGLPPKQYELHKTYALSEGEMPILGCNGFHACRDARVLIANLQLFGFAFDPQKTALLRVELSGTVVTDGTKFAGSCMTVLSVVPWSDAVLEVSSREGADLSAPWTDPRCKDILVFRANGDVLSIRRVRKTRTEWYLEAKLHRDGDKPAVEHDDGSKEWWRHGQRHRDGDQPAFVFASGRLEWWTEAKLHRDGDKPAVELSDGTKEWWFKGNLHRGDNKPAVERRDGSKEWWCMGAWVGCYRPGDDQAAATTATHF